MVKQVFYNVLLLIFVSTNVISEVNARLQESITDKLIANNEFYTLTTESSCIRVVSSYLNLADYLALVSIEGDRDVIRYLIPLVYSTLRIPVLVSDIDKNSKTEGKSQSIICHNCKDVNVGYLIVVKNEEVLEERWYQMRESQQVWNARAKIVIIVTSQKDKNCTEWNKNVFENLWKKYGVLNVVILSMGRENEIRFYHPFLRDNGSYGKFSVYKVLGVDWYKRLSVLKLSDMNGYPFKVYMFQWFVKKIDNQTLDSYYGYDGYTLFAMAEYMNVSLVFQKGNLNRDYGFSYENGTVTGSLGEVVSNKENLAFNSRFIKSYGVQNFDFTSPVFTDQLCVIVPRATRVPKWKSMLVSFGWSVYVITMVMYLLLASLRVIFKRVSSDISDFHNMDIEDIFLDTWHPFINLGFTRLPTTLSERGLVTCTLILGLLLVSTFQGRLVGVINNPRYYQDIDSLEQLDKSGLSITTSSASMNDTFAGNAVMENLRRKLTVVSSHSALRRVAQNGKVAALVRKSDAESRVHSFVGADGTELLHIVKECPRSYYLGYVMAKNSPYSQKVNGFLRRMFESGIVDKLMKKTRYDISNITSSKEVDVTTSKNNRKAFTLADLQLPFYILIIGNSLASVVFIKEMYKRCYP